MTSNHQKVQIKATSNFNDDLTSFGPKSSFDILEFLRLDQAKDLFYCYRIPIAKLETMHVNSKETFRDKQEKGQRPRFSIIKQIINPLKLSHYAVIDLNTKKAKFLN
ncbi:hypothetical protein [Helicobacter cetorum]|uniref:hypothetical protein n=1 Tax=Helicobacter cetorum TaxID=138563 RepID=UPI001F3753BE|nr:hypothetical protein [Helicobacter cetorum]